MPTHPVARLALRVGAPIAALLVAAAHAAAPTDETLQRQIGAGQPPAISNFRIDGGAPIAYDLTLGLTWTTAGQATQWRVATSGQFSSAPWQALPAAQPFKLLLPTGAQDGQHTISMQLRNDHGESPIANASIEFRRGPWTIESVVVTAADGSMRRNAAVDAGFTGRATHGALTRSAQPPGTDGPWVALAGGSSTGSPARFTANLETFQPAVTLVSGMRLDAYVHLRRDASPVVTKPASFVYTGPQVTHWLDVQQTRSFVARLGERNRIGAQLLTAAGKCQVFSSEGGGYIGGPVAQGFYVVGDTPIVKPMRCRFNLFDGKALAAGWTLAADSVQLMRNKCQVVTRTGGSTPNLALEVQLDEVLGTTGQARHESCHVEGLRLDGPWSDVTQPWLLAVP